MKYESKCKMTGFALSFGTDLAVPETTWEVRMEKWLVLITLVGFVIALLPDDGLIRAFDRAWTWLTDWFVTLLIFAVLVADAYHHRNDPDYEESYE